MASFCQDCSLRIFGKDFRDFAHGQVGKVACVLCEGCGKWIVVDPEGKKVEGESCQTCDENESRCCGRCKE